MKTSKTRRKLKLACDPKIKFLKIGLVHHLLQNPRNKLDTSIFVYTAPADTTDPAVNTKKIKALNITCNDPDKNAVLNEIMNISNKQELKKSRREQNLLVGNYVVFQHNTAENNTGIILGFSFCTEDYIRHAHLCKLIPKNHSFLCAGNFLIVKKPFVFFCLPLSNSWRIVKYFFKSKEYHSMMDEMNLMITHDTFRKFFNVDLNPPKSKSVDQDIKCIRAPVCRPRLLWTCIFA